MNLAQFDWSSEGYQGLFEEVIPTHLLENPLMEKDVWQTVDDMNWKVNAHRKKLTINFSTIQIDWLKLLAKIFIIVKFPSKSNSLTASNYIVKIASFSRFLVKHNILKPKDINDEVFNNYELYLIKNNIIDKGKSFSNIHTFLKTCRREGWLNIDTYWFKNKSKKSPKNDKKVEYIPEDVWHQLEENLYMMPEQFQRMVLIIKTTGIRVGELLTLPFDCLRKREGQWRIRLTTEKYDIEDEIPILVPELIAIIKEQQYYIQSLFEDKFKYLFCSNKSGGKSNGNLLLYPVAKVIHYKTFNNWLNRFAKKANIRSKDGELWHFSSHQFRRTVGTVMSNAGVRDLIVSKYLRHRSPKMLSHYQSLFKETLRDELKDLLRERKYVDITGKEVEKIKPNDYIAEYIRRKSYPRTTILGECHRSILKSPCPTVNACLSCKDWKVELEHLEDLKLFLGRINQELSITQDLGMSRQEQILQNEKNTLVRVIKRLEDNK